MKKIYILGEARGAYRTQNFIKLLLDNSNKYRVYYNSFFYKNIFLRYIMSLFVNPFIILFSNIIYVAALNVGPNVMYEIFIGRIFGKKVITEYYVSVYDTVILDRKMFKEKSVFSKLAWLYDKLILILSSKVIFLNQTEKERYCQLANVNPTNEDFVTIPLCIEEKVHVDSNFLKNKSSAINLCWWGSYLGLHGLDKIIEAMKLLQDKNIDAKLFIFGNSEEKSLQYKRKVSQLDLDEIVQIRNDYTFANGKLGEFLKLNCDISLGAFGDCEKIKNVITNKLLDACALRSIAVTGNSNAALEYFDGKNNVFFVENEPHAIANKIIEVINMDKQVLKNCIEKSYMIFKQNFSFEAFQGKMLKLLDEI